jgi:hypothetical protein
MDFGLKGLDAVIELEKLKISVPLRDIYEGLQFRPRPKLVQISEDADRNGGSCDLTSGLRSTDSYTRKTPPSPAGFSFLS